MLGDVFLIVRFQVAQKLFPLLRDNYGWRSRPFKAILPTPEDAELNKTLAYCFHPIKFDFLFMNTKASER